MKLQDIETLNCAWRCCSAIFYEPSKWRPPPWFEIDVHEQHYYAHLIDLAGDEILCVKHQQALWHQRKQVAQLKKKYRPVPPSLKKLTGSTRNARKGQSRFHQM